MAAQDTNRSLFALNILRKIFLEDWALKLTALGITLGLWLMVTGLSTPTTKRLTVPLNLSISSNAQITNAPREEIDVEITGDKNTLDRMNRSELAAFVDLTDRAPGEQIVSLAPDNVFVTLPQGVRLTDVAPSRIAVTLEAVEEKEVEVLADQKGNPAAGYELYEVSVQPPTIRVRGPASIVATLDFVQTERIDIAGKKEDLTTRQVPVRSPNPQAAVLNTFVDVVFHIGERRIERMFSVDVLARPDKTATFILYGPRTVITKAKPELFVVEMIKDEKGAEKPQVILPSELQDVVEVRELKIN